MFRHYLKVGVRSLAKQRGYSLINLLGLTLGIASAMVILLIVRYELSFDTFHEEGDQVYRVVIGETLDAADSGTPHHLMYVLQEELPEIEDAAVAYKLNPNETQVEVDNLPTRVEEIAFVSPSFFEMLSFEWTAGAPQQSLSEPGQAVINETLARNWFDGDAMGKAIRLNNEFELTITGIIEDMPKNTDFPLQMAVSHSTFEQSENYNDRLVASANSYYQTFLKLSDKTLVEQVESKFPALIESHLGEEFVDSYQMRLQPLSDVHYNEVIGNTNFSGRAVNKNMILTLALIGLLIAIIACINFVNLSTARAVKKAKEVGVRKVLGSFRRQLLAQFLVEAVLIVTAATVLSVFIAWTFLPTITNYLSIPIDSSLLFEPDVMLMLVAGWLLISVLPGLYPAWLISRFDSLTTVLKSSLQRKQGGGLLLRKGLIVVQFTITFLLIISTGIVVNQLDYIKSTSLGFDKEAVITLDLPSHSGTELETIRQQLLQQSSIVDVSFSLNTPASTINKWWTNYYLPSDPEQGYTMEHKAIDENYLDLFDIELVAGRNIQTKDSTFEVLINEAMMQFMGIEDPQEALNQTISFWRVSDAPVVGVVKDFNSVSLHSPIHPVMLWQGYTFMLQKGSIKINMSQAQEAIGFIEKSFADVFPNYYFSYAFLDEELSTFYWQEEKTSRVLSIFSIIAICIAGLGLYGLVSFMATQKVKEIGIRKILGASYLNIIRLFTNEFSLLITLAFLLASPIAYIFMQRWMEAFTFRTEIGWQVFLMAIVSGALLTIVSIGYQSLKAALVNPVENLRHE